MFNYLKILWKVESINMQVNVRPIFTLINDYLANVTKNKNRTEAGFWIQNLVEKNFFFIPKLLGSKAF